MRPLQTEHKELVDGLASTSGVRALACLVALLPWTVVAVAQDYGEFVRPRIELSADKPSYRLFEPVLLSVSVTNVSDEPQQFNALRMIGTRLRFRITDPDGEPVNMYGEPASIVGGLWPEDDETATPPGSTITATMLISHYYPLTFKVGVYGIEVGLKLGNGDDEWSGGTGLVQYPVVRPGNSDVTDNIIEPYGRALAGLEGVLDSSDPEVSYLTESAMFYLAQFDVKLIRVGQELVPPARKIDIDSRRPVTKAVQEYEAFIRQFPDSVFGDLAARGLESSRRRQQRLGKIR
jgi:hypothetical protein